MLSARDELIFEFRCFIIDKEHQNVRDSDSNSTGNGNNNSSTNFHFNEKTFYEGDTPVDIVSAAIMAKVLKEREKERSNKKHCQTCSCIVTLHDNKSCQTDENIFAEVRTYSFQLF